MKPPTLQQVEDYVREKNWFLVDPKEFWDTYEANDWHDRDNVPIQRWKGKVVSWHNREKKWLKSKGVKLVCRVCGKPGEYTCLDDTGQTAFLCIDHKPKPKPLPLPANIVPIMKGVPQGDKRSLSDKQREQRRKLGI